MAKLSDVRTQPVNTTLSYATTADFPTSNLAVGTKAIAQDTQSIYYWNGTAWYILTTEIVQPTSYVLSSSNTTINNLVSFTITLTTTNIAALTSIPYTITGVTESDIDVPLSGSFSIDVDGTSILTITTNSLVSAKTLSLSISPNNNISVFLTAVDPVIAYSLGTSVSSTNEGTEVTISLSTTGLPNQYEVPYTISGTGITPSDFVGFPALTGTFVITAGQSELILNIENDFTLEGEESFTLSIDGTTESVSVTINDTSSATRVGQQAWTTPGDYVWTVPAGVTSISMVGVGGGQAGGYGTYPSTVGIVGGNGGDGGWLAYRNNYSVIPGTTYSIRVGNGGNTPKAGSGARGTSSYIIEPLGSFILSASFGLYAEERTIAEQVSYNGGGGNGGSGTSPPYGATSWNSAGGGGAGGYAGVGGQGASYLASFPPTAGQGGGGGGGVGTYNGDGFPGGGVGILGQGANGAAYSGAGSGGVGRLYGGGGGGIRGGTTMGPNQAGGDGAIRIIWPGNTRQFPSTGTGNL